MTKVQSLDELSRMFAKEYAVVSLKFVREHLAHPKHPHAIANAKTLLKKAGFIRGRQVSLEDKGNKCGFTHCVCYWRKDYFNGVAPTLEITKELANKKVSGKAKPAAAAMPEPVADQPEEQTVAPEELIFEAAPLITAFSHLRNEAVKTYLRTLPPSHQRAFCLLYESVFQDLNGICTLKSEEDNTVHTFEACPMSEDARRFYNPLINMFYQDEEMWGAFVLWLELHGKPDLAQGWKSLLKPPYSESLRSAYFFLTDLDKMIQEKLASLTVLN
ncbi:hypothetical protein [Escherichia coli]|uniref:hypothetical protein n=1 Tax=Escherichia coli TaxID=562 RepID=UPI001125148D|nr:hypothetical protein [Escherichia coli]